MIILKSSSPLLALFRDNERVAKVVSLIQILLIFLCRCNHYVLLSSC